VPISIWYDWKNDGPDPTEREQNFGTVTHDLQPKPAYTALQTFTRELNGFRVERRLDISTNDFVILLRNDSGERKLAAWTATDAHQVSIAIVDKSNPVTVTVIEHNGKASTIQVERALPIDLTLAPKYIRLGKLKLAAVRDSLAE
jgi:hypothetical protein